MIEIIDYPSHFIKPLNPKEQRNFDKIYKELSEFVKKYDLKVSLK